jgi:hypothetical protein
MANESWKIFIVCPVCKISFRASKLNRHIKRHQGISKEEEIKIRNAVINGIRLNKLNSSRVKTPPSMINSTDLITQNKQFFYTGRVVSGGSFGQGKKK